MNEQTASCDTEQRIEALERMAGEVSAEFRRELRAIRELVHQLLDKRP